MRTVDSRRFVPIYVGFTVAFSVAPTDYAQPRSAPDYSRSLPIRELALRLESRYAKPVTWEMPVMVWRGELERLAFPNRAELLKVKPYNLTLPKTADPVLAAPAISIDVVRKELDYFHSQNPDRERYHVLESSMGFHIVPTAAYDENGVLRPVKNLLDTSIEVPIEKRTPTEHVEAILQEVSRSTGIHFREVYSLDARYAANNYTTSNPFPGINNASIPTPHDDRPYWLFAWGASEVTAREALIDLISGSATTMNWGLLCFPDFLRGAKQTCDFQVAPMVKGDTRGDVYLDRCTKCRPIPR